jgi:hypothetical protein
MMKKLPVTNPLPDRFITVLSKIINQTSSSRIMKRLLLITAAALLLASCTKKDNDHKRETITKGERWGIKIGSTGAEVYAQVQALSQVKDLSGLEVVGQYKFSSLDEIGERMTLYSGISLEMNNVVYPQRIAIGFGKEKVSYIDSGSAMLKPVPQWPAALPSAVALHNELPLNQLYARLKAIKTSKILDNYSIGLGAKDLSKGYDPKMETYERWYFVFFDNSRERYSISLYFKNGKLDKIYQEYDKFEIMD